MKKIAVVILMICYLAVSSGVIVNFHYCMNKLASTELFALESKKCGKCGMHTKDSNGCCRDEVKIVKMDDDQKISIAFDFFVPAMEPQVQLVSDFIVTSFYNSAGENQYQVHSPPLISPTDICLQNSVFRI